MERNEPERLNTPSHDVERLLRCINMAMGCISPLSKNIDERLAWFRLLDTIEGREPRDSLHQCPPTPRRDVPTLR